VTGEDRDLAQILDNPVRAEGCPTAWALQRHAMDELRGDERDEMAEHVARCAACREHLMGLDSAREAFLAERPFTTVEADVAERATFLPDDPEIEVEASTWSKLRLGLVSFAAGAVAMIVTVVFMPWPGDEYVPPHDGLKGTTGLHAALLRDGAVSQVEPGETLRAGDEVQFRVDTGGYAHVVVVGIDGRGEVAVYQPLDGEHSLAVEPGAGRTLEGGFRLDDAPGPEVWIAFFTDEPIGAAGARKLVGEWAGDGGAQAVIDGAPERALGGAVELLAVGKEAGER
jgi:hypothetical protein